MGSPCLRVAVRGTDCPHPSYAFRAVPSWRHPRLARLAAEKVDALLHELQLPAPDGRLQCVGPGRDRIIPEPWFAFGTICACFGMLPRSFAIASCLLCCSSRAEAARSRQTAPENPMR